MIREFTRINTNRRLAGIREDSRIEICAIRANMKLVTVMLYLTVLLSACGPTADPVIVTPASSDPVATEPAGSSVSRQEIAVPDEGGGHVPEGEEVTYQHYPPASGPHYAVTLQYGLYEGEEVPAEYWVHNLEHGAIVVLYQCDQPCPDLVKSLGDMLDSFPESKWGNRKIVIVPYSRMATPLMAVAWNVQLPLDRFDAQTLIDFYVRHVDQGPEDVP